MTSYPKDREMQASDQQIARAGDVLLGATALASPAWVTWFEHANVVLVTLASLGGLILVWWRVYAAYKSWADKRALPEGL